jgi:hypothetical protein
MSQPTACIRCKGTELVPVRFETGTEPRLSADAEHSSPMAARVCLACGAVLLTASNPAALRVAPGEERDVQEYDF